MLSVYLFLCALINTSAIKSAWISILLSYDTCKDLYTSSNIFHYKIGVNNVMPKVYVYEPIEPKVCTGISISFSCKSYDNIGNDDFSYSFDKQWRKVSYVNLYEVEFLLYMEGGWDCSVKKIEFSIV